MVPVYPISSQAGMAAAVDALRAGEIIAYPTDTLYGVGGDALSADAVGRVQRAKGREEGKGTPVLLADAAEVTRLAAEWPAAAARLAERYWPGALTVVVAARADVPEGVRTGANVALRVPGHPRLRELIRRAGVPLIGTSANRSGEPPAVTARAAADALGESVRLVLDGGRVGGAPSTVVVVESGGVRVVREGAIPSAEVLAAAGAVGAAPTPG
ncbi:MAG TPA: L-threonylcarbamoyladenylate synthase [Chloroflexota bacterium]|nr:L-threonylcarbamoyladenylate synthase [Chloroflexota bacterium]